MILAFETHSHDNVHEKKKTTKKKTDENGYSIRMTISIKTEIKSSGVRNESKKRGPKKKNEIFLCQMQSKSK